MVPSTGLPLFEGAAHVGELGAQGAADIVDDGNNDDAEAPRDHAIFDRGRTGLILEKLLE
jgi:hypothetical protein